MLGKEITMIVCKKLKAILVDARNGDLLGRDLQNTSCPGVLGKVISY